MVGQGDGRTEKRASTEIALTRQIDQLGGSNYLLVGHFALIQLLEQLDGEVDLEVNLKLFLLDADTLHHIGKFGIVLFGCQLSQGDQTSCHIGEFSDIHADVSGNVLSDAEWTKRRGDFLPSDDDRAFIESLMQPNFEIGKFAGWIAPPKVGIDNKPGDFEYVKIT